MSVESAEKFLEKMNTDKDFHAKVSSCKDVPSRRQLVEGEGFDFTADELEMAKAELSPEQLSTIAGGFCFLKCDITCDTFQDRCVDCYDIS